MAKKWYEDGVQFKCTGCGGCCTGSPGYVMLKEEDIERLHKYLKISRKEFLEKYTRQVYEKISLKELPAQNYDCIFLKDKKRCSVYPARPRQCATYPDWIQIRCSETAWNNEAKRCEGINHPDGELIQLGKH